MVETSQIIDATGLLCPLPVLKLRKGLSRVDIGQSVTLKADDAAAIIDVPHFCAEAGHRLENHQTDTAPYIFTVVRQK